MRPLRQNLLSIFSLNFVTFWWAVVLPSSLALNDIANGYFSIYSGFCTTASDGNCFNSPNYPSDYGYSEYCSIYVNNATSLDVIEFYLESSYDYLTVNSTSYSGSNGPDNVAVAADSFIYFSSDSSVSYSGFSICASSTTPLVSTTSSSGTTDIDPTVIIIIICVSAFCCVCLSYCRYCRNEDNIDSEPQVDATSIRTESFVSQPIRKALTNNAVAREGDGAVAEPRTHGLSILDVSHDQESSNHVLSLVVVEDAAWEKNLSGYELIQLRLRADENLSDANRTVL